MEGSFIRGPGTRKNEKIRKGALGGGPRTPKIFGVPKMRFFDCTLQKNENWKKIFFGGWGPRPTPYPTPKNRNRPLGPLFTFGENFIRIRARKLEIYACKVAALYKSLPWDLEFLR